MVPILKWVVWILLSPLIAVLLVWNSISPFQGIYVIAFRVVNRTARPLWITPVGTYDPGKKVVLYQFISEFFAFPAFREKNHRVRPGGSRRICFDRKRLGYYEIVVHNAQGEYRQLVIDPVPSKENTYRLGQDFVIENWDGLVPASADVLAAALEPGRSWRIWMVCLLGFPMFVFYRWLLG